MFVQTSMILLYEMQKKNFGVNCSFKSWDFAKNLPSLDLRSTQTFTQRKHEAINQAEELEQRLSSSIQTQKELEDQLNESRSRLGQMELVWAKNSATLSNLSLLHPLLPEKNYYLLLLGKRPVFH